MIGELVNSLPLWAILLGTLGIVLLALWLGNRFGQYYSKQTSDEAPTNAVIGAHLGLLAFFLAFSFNMASEHYDQRRKLMLEEINVLDITYSAAELMSDQGKGETVRELLRRYVDIRARLSPGTDFLKAIQQSDAILADIQRIIVSLAGAQGLKAGDSMFVRSMNEVVSYHHRRVAAAFHYRIPGSIWPALYAILTFSMIGLGYTFGLKQSRNHLGSLALALSFSMVIYLIADLDQPLSGLVIADQSAMQRLGNKLAQ